ncbi:MAG: stage II sporulation protein D [Clostridiaceae bacterium]|nr:stage II sporulation protein D [Clostridiaceae bacterium]
MKKILFYVLLMILAIVVLPFTIVRGCSSVIDDIVPPEKDEVLKIKVYFHTENTVSEMPLEEYLKGVVAAEMPAEFELEALKAQAVAARTYAYGRMKKIYTPKDDIHNGADICSNSAHCQAWASKEEMMKKWGFFKRLEYWNKIERAVEETENIIVVYEGKVINPLFHANSGGKTENCEEVWPGVEVPYLRSVKSDGEEASSGYKVVTAYNENELIETIKKGYPDIKLNEDNIFEDIKIIDYTEGGRVSNLGLGNITVKGTDFRNLLGLRSANFKLDKAEGGKIEITTIGHGHGVGMSQWGANHLAKNGGNFEEIIKYYYKGVSLENCGG